MLQKIENKGYPTDYLFSRLRVRKINYQNLLKNRLVEDVWNNLLLEYKWVYCQMNEKLRNIFSPFFLYFELRNILILIRYKTSSEEKISEILKWSLLSKELKRNLIYAKDVFIAIRYIEEAFSPISNNFLKLSTIFKCNGFKQFEHNLIKIYFEGIIESSLEPDIKNFLKYLIDSKNILILYKRLRWNIQEELELIKGGNIDPRLLEKCDNEKNIDKILILFKRFTGLKVDLNQLENSLIRGSINLFKKNMSDPLSLGFILNYLWSCYIQTIQLSIKQHK
jgi:vacuolar-type H+-ATPase subunit C/Vma6